MKFQLEFKGITLESGFVDTQVSQATVIIFHVDLAQSFIRTKTPVVKYSRREYAIPRAKCLKLATPTYYRNYEGNATGVRDEMEGRYQEDVRSYLGKCRKLDVGNVSMVSGNVTHAIDDFYMFCTSLKTTFTREQEHIRRGFDSDCETRIQDPSEFARVLGADFAASSIWSDVQLNPLEEILQKSARINKHDNTVLVYHGPVLYTDNAAELVDNIPILHRAAAVSFVKRQNFAQQNEYRFKIKTIGKPEKSECFLPISPKLRRLAEIDWGAL